MAIQTQDRWVCRVPDPDEAELLARYDAQLRAQLPDRLPEDVYVERDGRNPPRGRQRSVPSRGQPRAKPREMLARKNPAG
jgi:hypothetical protein